MQELDPQMMWCGAYQNTVTDSSLNKALFNLNTVKMWEAEEAVIDSHAWILTKSWWEPPRAQGGARCLPGQAGLCSPCAAADGWMVPAWDRSAVPSTAVAACTQSCLSSAFLLLGKELATGASRMFSSEIKSPEDEKSSAISLAGRQYWASYIPAQWNYGSQLVRVSHSSLAPQCVEFGLQGMKSPSLSWTPVSCAEVGVWAPWLLVATGLMALVMPGPLPREQCRESPASSRGLLCFTGPTRKVSLLSHHPGVSVSGKVHFSVFRAKFSQIFWFHELKIEKDLCKIRIKLCFYEKSIQPLKSGLLTTRKTQLLVPFNALGMQLCHICNLKLVKRK